MRPRAGMLAAVVVLAAIASACVSPRNTLGTSSSPCYRAVPVATDAVHDRGSLAGVRLVGARELARHPELRATLEARTGHHLSQVCVVSFHGAYRPDQVETPLGHAPGGGTGPVAIVVVTNPGNTLVGTFVVVHEPLPLRHEVLARTPAPPDRLASS